jgi:hypothetical protein
MADRIDMHGYARSGVTPTRPYQPKGPGAQGCQTCKRPAGQTHDHWCPDAGTETATIPPLNLAAMRKPTMPSATITEAKAALGLSDQPNSCRCGAIKQGKAPMCRECMTANAKASAVKRLLNKAARVAPAALAQAVDRLTPPDPDLVVINEPEPVVRKLETTDPNSSKSSNSSEPAPNHPESPDSSDLDALRAERERCAAYLAGLDRRIEQAEALEALAWYDAAALADMLAVAEFQARQIRLALQLREVPA